MRPGVGEGEKKNEMKERRMGWEKAVFDVLVSNYQTLLIFTFFFFFSVIWKGRRVCVVTL